MLNGDARYYAGPGGSVAGGSIILWMVVAALIGPVVAREGTIHIQQKVVVQI